MIVYYILFTILGGYYDIHTHIKNTHIYIYINMYAYTCAEMKTKGNKPSKMPMQIY